jgi:hypothetical protein
MKLKAWEIKNFAVQEIECDKSDIINNGNIFDNKEDAIKNAIDNINRRVSKNTIYLERIQKDLREQEDILLYYLKKRNELILEAKVENIKIDEL